MMNVARRAEVHRAAAFQASAPSVGSRDIARVNKHGFTKWHQKSVFISSALKHEHIELELNDDDRWNMSWGSILLG